MSGLRLAPGRRTTPAPGLLTTLLALLTAVGPISTDMYLPAFPDMRVSLHAQPGQTQVTLAAWFVGLAVGQLTHGHLADQYGRRQPLLFGTLLYTLASVGCAMAETMSDLSWWRLWAAFGGAASLVIPRAIIADVAKTGPMAATMLSRMVIVMGVVPALAPVLGGVIASGGNWRLIFWIAAAYGVICTALIFLFLPDTLRHRGRRLRVSETAARYIIVLRDRTFCSFALQGGCATFSLFAFLGGAPGVFQVHYGLTPERFSLLFIVNTVGYVCGTQANARLLARRPSALVLTGGTTALLGVCTAMVVLGVTGIGGPWALAVGMGLFMACLGVVLPGAAIGSMMGHGRVAGAASAMYGTVVFFIGSVGTGLVGWLGTPPVVMTALMAVGGVMALGCDRWRGVSMRNKR